MNLQHRLSRRPPHLPSRTGFYGSGYSTFSGTPIPNLLYEALLIAFRIDVLQKVHLKASVRVHRGRRTPHTANLRFVGGLGSISSRGIYEIS